ncbi:protein brambleberry-like isoform X2 [Dermacentor silvarum]|uniref:protein brambleberry-like isoform X2 n=1 Tax=Dermacentor silvarum TaxID=543639 RepID=UPI0021007D8E|nr:protein brambleberry-like isoform X2 [Dermacentor silvarum]
MHPSTVLFFLTVLVPANCFFSWFATKPVPVPTSKADAKDFTKDGTVAVVPFEMKTADDEFLQEGKKYGLQLSTLDVCHHKVLLGLTSSCSKLNEEDLGKLSVRLLNCQSAVEGRPTFPCTDEMPLRQCTQGMDQHTWNTYHLISNRARAVCYSTRQQQFYAKTEMTVNKLVWTTDQQVKAMGQLEQEQQKVSALTSQTLETMSSGQKALMQQQEKLKSSQQSVQNFVTENLKELMLEKALIAAGQRELAQMTNTIRKKLDAASTMMLSNEQQRQVNHQELLKDLSAVQNYAKFLQERLEQTSQVVLSHQETAAVRFEETLSNLGKINASIGYVQEVIDTMRKDVDSKFGWLVRLLHSTGDQLSAIYCCVLHCCYLLVAMFLAAFLQFPMPSRVFLLFIVPVNAVASIRETCGLDFGPLTVLLAIFLAGDVACHAIRGFCRRRSSRRLALDARPCENLSRTANSFTMSRQAMYTEDSTRHEDGRHVSGAATPLNNGVKRSSSRHCRRVSATASRSSTPLLEERQTTPPVSDVEEDSSSANVSRWLLENAEAGTMPDVVPATSTPVASPVDHLLQTSRKENGHLAKQHLFSSFDRRSRGSFRDSPDRSFASNTSMLSNGSRRRCSGFNKSGVPCKGTCLKGQDYCHHHC